MGVTVVFIVNLPKSRYQNLGPAQLIESDKDSDFRILTESHGSLRVLFTSSTVQDLVVDLVVGLVVGLLRFLGPPLLEWSWGSPGVVLG